MDKVEYENLRRETLEKQAQYLRDNSEIGAWVKTRKMLLRFLQGYWILHFVLSMVIMALQHSLTGGVAGVEIFKLLFQLFWMFIFVNPRGNWRLGIMLYVSAVFNFMLLIQNGKMVLELFSYLPALPVLSMLLYGLLIAMEVLAPFLLLVIAIYLTVPKKHREWSERAEVMYKSTAQELNDMVNKR